VEDLLDGARGIVLLMWVQLDVDVHQVPDCVASRCVAQKTLRNGHVCRHGSHVSIPVQADA
jgi:hypothetical protein